MGNQAGTRAGKKGRRALAPAARFCGLHQQFRTNKSNLAQTPASKIGL
jgi:hypothetical protein